MTPDTTVRVITDTPPLLVQYGPSLAVIAAFIALFGVWRSNKAAATRTKEEIIAAEERRKADEDAAGKRERARHRRETLTARIGDVLAAADLTLTESTRLRALLVGIANTSDISYDPNLARLRSDHYGTILREQIAAVDQFTSLYHQATILSPSPQVAGALNALGEAVAECSNLAREVTVGDTNNVKYVAVTERISPLIGEVAERYREEYAER